VKNIRLTTPAGLDNRFILSFYTLLSLILTYPLIFNLTAAVPNDIGDPLLNTWILAWDGHALLTRPLELFNANIFYPLPNTLAYSEHLFSTALLALPIQLISDEPVLAYNLSLLLTFPLAAFGMYLLAYRWTHRRGAAFIAGLIFGFAPYRFAAIAHLQLLTFQWLPVALLYLDKILTARLPGLPRFRHLLAFGLFLALQILASWYLALYTGLILAGYVLIILLVRRRPTVARLAGLLATALIVLVLVLPFILPYFSLFDELRQARPLSLALTLAAAPTDFFAAAPFNRLFGPLTGLLRTRPGFTEENTLFLGLVTPLLSLVGLFKILAPRSSLTAYRAIALALLSTLTLSLLLTFPALYAWLANIFPPSTVVRVPARWIIPALFALAGLSAFGYKVINDHLSMRTAKPGRARRSTLYLITTCTALLLAETVSTPLPLAQVDTRPTLNPAYHWLAKQPEEVVLVELPLHSAPAPEFPEVKRLYASTLGWWPLVNGYSGYTPPRQPGLARALSDFPTESATNTLQRVASISAPQPLLLFIHPGEAPLDRFAWETEDRWQAERQPALYPIGEFEGNYLYQVMPPGPDRFTGSPLGTFGSEQTIRLLAIDSPLLPSIENNPRFTRPAPRSPDSAPRLILYWQTTTAIPTNYTVFIHLRAPDGFIRAQADGPPVNGHYPPRVWPPYQVIQDVHPLPSIEDSQIDHLALGLYDPETGERLPAFGPNNEPLPDNALLIPLQ